MVQAVLCTEPGRMTRQVRDKVVGNCALIVQRSCSTRVRRRVDIAIRHYVDEFTFWYVAYPLEWPYKSIFRPGGIA